jgi:hypothetical protein
VAVTFAAFFQRAIAMSARLLGEAVSAAAKRGDCNINKPAAAD